MDITIKVLTFVVSVLVVLQGWQMISVWRKNSNNKGNPGSNLGDILTKMDTISEKLDHMNFKLGKTQQRTEDIWDEIKEK